MSTDPVQLPELLAALPREGDYDAVYAEVMKTARGRWFLSEYSARTRDADTQALIGAIARVEAAIRDDPPASISGALARELDDLATAIHGIEEAMAAGGILARDGFPAAERIQDIAFALREGKVDAAMCEALEAASRQLAHVFARNDAAMERAQGAISQLRELAGRIDAIVARAHAGASAGAEATRARSASDREGAATEPMLGEAPGAVRADADIFDDDQFAAQVGVLAASLSASATREEESVTAIGALVADADAYSLSAPLPRELFANDDTTTDEATGEASINKTLPSTEFPDERELDDSAATAGLLREKSAGQGALFGHEPAAPVVDAQRDAAFNKSALAKTVGNPDRERLQDTAQPSDMAAAPVSVATESDIDSIFEPEAVLSALPDSQAMAGPEEDPADLFEPAPPPSASPTSPVSESAAPASSNVAANAPPDVSEVTAPMQEEAAPREDKAQATSDSLSAAATDQISPREPPTLAAAESVPDQVASEPSWRQPHDAAIVRDAHVIPRATAGESRDPLAALRALSEDELIALFS
jgi:hypothetical protein